MKKDPKTRKNALSSELLILADGRIFVQNLTQPMAELLHALNPKDQTIAARAEQINKHGLSN
jgi:uncharacterized protein (DUF3084 family)